MTNTLCTHTKVCTIVRAKENSKPNQMEQEERGNYEYKKQLQIRFSDHPPHIKLPLYIKASTHSYPHTSHPCYLPAKSDSYLELLQLLFDHFHLSANQALCVQSLFGLSQQALQLGNLPVELLNSPSSVFDLVQPGLAALAQLENREKK